MKCTCKLVLITLVLFTTFQFCASERESTSTRLALDLTDTSETHNSKPPVNTLKMVQVIFRHGDRTPLRTYPNDPYKETKIFWPLGLGELTEKGKDQHYDLGSFFRQRYNGFVSELYSPEEVHVLSSDTDRTLMSAEANTAGLFPKLNHTLMASELSGGSRDSYSSPSYPSFGFSKVGVQLVPIHTITPENDKLLKMSAPCPRKNEASVEFYATSKEFHQLTRENEEFINFIEEKMGLEHSQNMFQTLKYHDTLICQKAHGMRLPEWADDPTMKRMARLRSIGFAMASGTTELKRLKGGPLVKRILKHMLAYEKATSQKRERTKKTKSKLSKMFVHSGHDDTLAAVMSSMGVFHPQLPSYASAFIVELHQGADGGDYYVQLFFRNSTKSDALPLQVPGCDVACPLSTLITLLEPIIPLDWDQECQPKKGNLNADNLQEGSEPISNSAYARAGSTIIICLAGFIAFVFLILTIIYFAYFRNRMFRERRGNSRGTYNPI